MINNKQQSIEEIKEELEKETVEQKLKRNSIEEQTKNTFNEYANNYVINKIIFRLVGLLIIILSGLIAYGFDVHMSFMKYTQPITVNTFDAVASFISWTLFLLTFFVIIISIFLIGLWILLFGK